MKSGRITIAGLIGVIAVAGLGMAALRSPSPLVAQLSVTASLTVLLIATLAAILSVKRAPAIGFVLFGWGYLVLVFGPIFSNTAAPWLVSSRLLDELYFRVVGKDDPIVKLGVKTWHKGAFEGEDLDRAMRSVGDTRFLQFRVIGHSLFTLVHGTLGAIVAMILKRQGRTSKESSP